MFFFFFIGPLSTESLKNRESLIAVSEESATVSGSHHTRTTNHHVIICNMKKIKLLYPFTARGTISGLLLLLEL